MEGAAATGLKTLGDVVTFVMGLFSSMVSTITSAPILMLSLGIFVVGAVIGLAYRLIRG